MRIKTKLFWIGITALPRLSMTWLIARFYHQQHGDEAFLTAAYRALLGRNPDEGGKTFYLQQLSQGLLRWRGVLLAIVKSHEFLQRSQVALSPSDAIHIARMKLVRAYLPPAEIIVDLGGASAHTPLGALLVMGYPHRAKEITIVDLPIGERMGDWDPQAEPPVLTAPNGTTVRYLYRSLADLTPLPDATVDLVFSGESIEHVTQADAERAVAEAYRILKPGGLLCLDTPNRALTILHSPEQLIHPEHKKEYLFNELTTLITQQGFVITRAKSICPMPRSLAKGRFDWDELMQHNDIGDKPEEGYLFYLECQKALRG